MNHTRRSVLILGASTRAAADSAVRAGLQPICADRFADEDLQAVARVLPLHDYPHGLPTAAAAAPLAPWMYVGALENHPRLIAEISRQRPLWGNPPAALAVARDPFAVERILTEAHLPALAVRRGSNPPVADGTWMLKPVRSAGGHGIRIWQHEAANAATLDETYYFQCRQIGETISALFLGTAAGAAMIGVARQLVGVPSLNASDHGYCGSIGPIDVGDRLARQIERVGRVLAESCRLRGLFGCDFVLSEETAWLTEVNPRYTASVEIYELAYQRPFVDWHARACETFEHEAESAALAESVTSEIARLRTGPPMRVVGKAVLYATGDVEVPDLGALAGASERSRGPAEDSGPESHGEQFTVPMLADRPAAGMRIKRGQPICTILSAGRSEADCSAALAASISDVSRRVFGTLAHGRPT